MPHRHFRIGHYGESAGDTSDVFVAIPPEAWYCDVCAEKNDDGGSFCHNCSNERGNWICPDCAHLNRRASTECESCGRPKPEDVDGD